MSSDLPDWLSELAPKDGEEEIAPVVEESDVAPDMMADLRSQFDETDAPTAAEQAVPKAQRRQRSSLEFGLMPWQRFFLSLLLFLDVTIVGLLFLVMLGRIAIPVF